ncbi:uncharacterized protein LOC8275603 [Ricinus communis]|uniref:Uncharacterized protein n=1 Tax=Ricinus communis TaxID=3988 RepID=B9RRT1_RICCO|nr:uncharacterized protein LOC8275603 [Ricinus communis]EEF45791.1 conserved hypothetical protein [Ricinus communis]|eukprot:XP_002516450.1 uncharacterized protein LOC8275603 [Ricinus communis]
MADKPSRALVLYGDGLAQLIDESHTHIHSLASKASCGFLSLPNAPSSESENERIVREFAHLVDAYDAYQEMSNEKCTLIPTISQRFMEMKAAIITDNPSLQSFGSKLGFTVLSFKCLNGTHKSHYESSFEDLTSELLKLLGFQEGKTIEASQFDLVILHTGASELLNSDSSEATECDAHYLNSMVKETMYNAKPGSEIGSRLHLSLVMSYGNASKIDSTNLSVLVSKDEMNSDLSVLVPRQSYTMKGEKLRDNVRHHCPMLIAQWQHAVTRKDTAETYSYKEFKEHGVNLVIPADRFIHEVAFKLWKAPKYGA